MYYWVYDYGLFILQYTSSDKGLTRIAFISVQENCNLIYSENPFVDIHRYMLSYIDKNPIDIDVALDFSPTAFQKKVYDASLKIPFGEIITYKELAIMIDNPKAARAVGGALGKNPFPMYIPCHRIIGNNGALTGFSAPDGINLKKKLIDFERNDTHEF
ncbi:MAG: methylated-DNA--[protein]-cysteine S-methyltransferase [Clostridiales bacterium]|nr:methylated-DNA--[protein]-cysteine S-methyltransferase [Clostridiales bacterium]